MYLCCTASSQFCDMHGRHRKLIHHSLRLVSLRRSLCPTDLQILHFSGDVVKIQKKKICVLISPKSTYSVWYSVQISTPSWSLDMFTSTFHDSSNSVQIELTQTYSSFASLFSELGAFGPNTLASSCKELTHWKRPWCWERLRLEGEGDDRGWDGWMASPTRWIWV